MSPLPCYSIVHVESICLLHHSGPLLSTFKKCVGSAVVTGVLRCHLGVRKASEMACCGTGPGFATPRDAFRYATREKLVYIPCIVPSKDRPDYLATVDIDPESPTFCKAWSNYIIENLRSSLHTLKSTSEIYAEILRRRLHCKCNKFNCFTGYQSIALPLPW